MRNTEFLSEFSQAAQWFACATIANALVELRQRFTIDCGADTDSLGSHALSLSIAAPWVGLLAHFFHRRRDEWFPMMVQWNESTSTLATRILLAKTFLMPVSL